MSRELEQLGDTIIQNCFTAYECTHDQMEHAQVLCVAEEAGEFVGAFRRWRGLARRPGTYDEMASELADVIIASYAAASVIGIDLDAAIERKRRKVLTRGWKEDASGVVTLPADPQPVTEDATAAQGSGGSGPVPPQVEDTADDANLCRCGLPKPHSPEEHMAVDPEGGNGQHVEEDTSADDAPVVEVEPDAVPQVGRGRDVEAAPGVGPGKARPLK